jgi:uncharacterized protein YjbI with pentapeptide repeats
MVPMKRVLIRQNTFMRIGVIVLLLLCVVLLIILVLLSDEWLWWRLNDYIQPEGPTQRKDLVNAFVLIVGGVVAFLIASAAMGNLYMTRRNLRQQRELDERRAQDDALQAYYEQVGYLLTEHKLGEVQNRNHPVRLLAQAQTQTVLRRVDGKRKGDLVRFLSGGQLIGGENIISLAGVDLSRADLKDANLCGAVLGAANLSRADLSIANLRGVDLSGANLNRADLSGANLSRADLSEANLILADLSEANLTEAGLGAANLTRANLSGARLRRANLILANLSGADLSGADLYEAKFASAIMPNQQKYEDWIKTQEGGTGSPQQVEDPRSTA